MPLTFAVSGHPWPAGLVRVRLCHGPAFPSTCGVQLSDLPPPKARPVRWQGEQRMRCARTWKVSTLPSQCGPDVSTSCGARAQFISQRMRSTVHPASRWQAWRYPMHKLAAGAAEQQLHECLCLLRLAARNHTHACAHLKDCARFAAVVRQDCHKNVCAVAAGRGGGGRYVCLQAHVYTPLFQAAVPNQTNARAHRHRAHGAELASSPQVWRATCVRTVAHSCSTLA